MKKIKLAIVGAGPAGIATAIEAKANKIEPVIVLEKSENVCNTIVKFYKPGKRVDANFKGSNEKPIGLCSFETETKEEFLERIKNWIKKWDLDIRTNAEVVDIIKKDGEYEICLKNEEKFLADFVVIAIGIFGKPNKPSYPIPAEIKDRVFFEPPGNYPENGKVLVVGGGNSAAEIAYALCEKNEVFLSYRREKFFRINENNLKILEEKAKEGKIKLLLGTDIEKVEAFDDKIKVYFKGGKEEIYDYIFYCLGGTTPKGFLRKIGIEFNEEGEVVIDEFFETNLPGVFLAGDIAVKNGNIIKAFNTAHLVVKRIKEKYLENKEK